MSVKNTLIVILLSLVTFLSQAQVKIRLFADNMPRTTVFTVRNGRYVIKTAGNSEGIPLSINIPVIITRFDGKLAVKIKDVQGFVCDSVIFTGATGNDVFSLRVPGTGLGYNFYTGSLSCYSDMSSLILVNNCKIESYICGVVETEGGTAKNPEYFKTQAILARTYLFRNFNKHIADGYNLCDNTHCQAFNGLTGNPDIKMAVSQTRGLVIIGQDSSLIVAAFHSNCGGETSSSEDAWLKAEPYLVQVKDPFCHSSRNASWTKKVSLKDWEAMLQRAGYNGKTGDANVFAFKQEERASDYITTSFKMPLRSVRDAMKLRSTYFSVYPEKDSLLLKGKGYGHGVGLCQEGAMTMARQGYSYKQIIDFYYKGVTITDIKNAVILPGDNVTVSFSNDSTGNNESSEHVAPTAGRRGTVVHAP
ncbi:MAG TPA: SpoIID/LytB domain-containing protein [Bacteroidales bacterium]|nr:SpoIID/LytB domain-containing protein [Bacteroidales bacterium]